jgi:hypothetical protein
VPLDRVNLNMKPIAALAFTTGCILLLVAALGALSLNWETDSVNGRTLTPVATASNNTLSLEAMRRSTRIGCIRHFLGRSAFECHPEGSDAHPNRTEGD